MHFIFHLNNFELTVVHNGIVSAFNVWGLRNLSLWYSRVGGTLSRLAHLGTPQWRQQWKPALALGPEGPRPLSLWTSHGGHSPGGCAYTPSHGTFIYQEAEWQTPVRSFYLLCSGHGSGMFPVSLPAVIMYWLAWQPFYFRAHRMKSHYWAMMLEYFWSGNDHWVEEDPILYFVFPCTVSVNGNHLLHGAQKQKFCQDCIGYI